MTGGDAGFADLLADSYLELVGEPLLPGDRRGAEAYAWLYEAPFGLLAHDTSADPRFIYANRRAQELFGYGWEELIGLPSRLSAGPQDRDSRSVFMDSVRRTGYSDGYRGQRVTKEGRSFWIEDATVWNLLGADRALKGQAALIRHVSV
ncbi:MEKHLA domain-containing protein [Actinoplanes solisilvae]|uniref:MEKHLA domain-containing protein n=1 Tax=Actinoplanes solisilvae TaxID=2486853 RepID=UPI00196A32E4|nr:MEKHLA domain-containing protein [Actinoplanes solisilvae]